MTIPYHPSVIPPFGEIDHSKGPPRFLLAIKVVFHLMIASRGTTNIHKNSWNFWYIGTKLTQIIFPRKIISVLFSPR